MTAIESGRGVAFTMPAVMRNFGHARIAVVPVTDLQPAAVVLAWRTATSDPLVRAFVDRAKDVLSAIGTNADADQR